MTPQHPAAPEGETDAGGLTDLFDRAHDEVVRLCQPGESWRMSIPANPDRDSDLILSDALTKAADLAERLRFVEGERDALADQWDDSGWLSPEEVVDLTARAESAEARLRAVEALADEWDRVAGRHFAAILLRALLECNNDAHWTPEPSEGNASGLTGAEVDKIREAYRRWLPLSYEGGVGLMTQAVERIMAERSSRSVATEAEEAAVRVAEWQEATGAELPGMARAAMRVYAARAESAEAAHAALVARVEALDRSGRMSFDHSDLRALLAGGGA